MDELQAFLQAMHEQPEDEVTRLVFADWLQERDDPRAEYIRAAHEWMLADREASQTNPDDDTLERCASAWANATKQHLQLLGTSLRWWSNNRVGGTTFCGLPEVLLLTPEAFANIVSEPDTRLVSHVRLDLYLNHVVQPWLRTATFPCLTRLNIRPSCWKNTGKSSPINPPTILDWLDSPSLPALQEVTFEVWSYLEQNFNWLSRLQPPCSWKDKTIRVETGLVRAFDGNDPNIRLQWYDRFAESPLGKLVSAENHAESRRTLTTNVLVLTQPYNERTITGADFFRMTKNSNRWKMWSSPAESSPGTRRAQEFRTRNRRAMEEAYGPEADIPIEDEPIPGGDWRERRHGKLLRKKRPWGNK